MGKRRIEYWTGDRCPLVQQVPGQSHTLRSHSVYDWSIFAHSNKLYHSVKETLQVLRCLWEKKTQKKKRNGRESSQDHDSIKNHRKKKKKKALGLSESGHHQDVRGTACDKQDRRKEKARSECGVGDF